MERKFGESVSNDLVQSLVRPFFVGLPVSTAFSCSLKILDTLFLDDLLDKDQFVYLRHLFVAYRDILSE